MTTQPKLADHELTRELLADPTLPIPDGLPRYYRDIVLVARGQEDCRHCFGSAVNLENYQELEPCPACNGTGVAKWKSKLDDYRPRRYLLAQDIYRELFNLTMQFHAFCNTATLNYEALRDNMVQSVSNGNEQGIAAKWQHLEDSEGRRLIAMIKEFMNEQA